MTPPNPVDVVERAYELQTTDREWLASLARCVFPLLDGGLGLYAYRYDIRQRPTEWFATAVKVDMTNAVAAAVESTVLAMEGGRALEDGHAAPSGPLSTVAEAASAAGLTDILHAGPLHDLFHSIEARDAMSLRTIEPGGRGLMLLAFQRNQRTLDRRTKRLWSRVSVHLAAARRLRQLSDVGDAVLTPSGKLDHAEGDATAKPIRELLREAVLRRERARGRARREDPEGATEMWTGLVSGRWSLVDQFERNGRRFVVARRNEHGCIDPRALTERERVIAHLAALAKSNKLIAYELGLAESTVATHLAEAMRKLGVRSRVELMPLLAQLANQR